MLGTIVFAVAGIWLLVVVLVLALCRDAKAGDEALEIACGRVLAGDDEPVVIQLADRRPERNALKLPRLA